MKQETRLGDRLVYSKMHLVEHILNYETRENRVSSNVIELLNIIDHCVEVKEIQMILLQNIRVSKFSVINYGESY